VRLFDRSAQFGRGRAYSTTNERHLLNVRTGNMSAFPDQPGHFQAWLAAQALSAGPQDFVSRGLYGIYLQVQLRDALASFASGRFILEADEVVILRPAPSGGWVLASRKGRQFAADAIVLAVGLMPPHALPGASDRLLRSRGAYFSDPWSRNLQEVPAGDVLLVGSGLTMVDVALELARRGRRLAAISRRGLLPRSHASTAAVLTPRGDLGSPLEALRTMRRHAKAVGWRDAVDSIRPVTQTIWRDWPLKERRRFLRHLRPWWDVHRHRMAPAVTAEIHSLMAAGGLTVTAGRILSLDLDEDGAVILRFREKGESALRQRRFAAVINCTGPHGDLAVADSPLLADLRLQGLVRNDPLSLGLDVDEHGRALGRNGRSVAGLFVVGPLTRGAVWESMAVPDLRNQAAQAAACLAADLGATLGGCRTAAGA
jgi:uncharacterized NAD(P)/FAD-binding protein YdhS